MQSSCFRMLAAIVAEPGRRLTHSYIKHRRERPSGKNTALECTQGVYSSGLVTHIYSRYPQKSSTRQQRNPKAKVREKALLKPQSSPSLSRRARFFLFCHLPSWFLTLIFELSGSVLGTSYARTRARCKDTVLSRNGTKAHVHKKACTSGLRQPFAFLPEPCRESPQCGTRNVDITVSPCVHRSSWVQMPFRRCCCYHFFF